MELPTLITTDLHLVEDESCSYRWDLFPWINQQIDEMGIKSVRILGDLTDAKDRHSASLVNKVVNAIKSINCPDVKILAGNHDWLLKGQEFFRFLNHLPNVQFITEPWDEPDYDSGPIRFLPYTKTPGIDWKGYDFSHYRYVFMHQTIKGAVASNGEAMEGEGVPDIDAGRVYSGDIHVPQTIRGVTYIGSPYHVHFGDNFEPRVLVLDRREREHWLKFPSPRRIMLKVNGWRQLKAADLVEGDQVKLRVVLPHEDRHQWMAFRRDAVKLLQDRGVKLFGIELVSPEVRAIKQHQSVPKVRSELAALDHFVSSEEWTADALDAALDIIESP